MAEENPIVLNLQSDAMDETVPVSRLLRTAKVIATKLNLDDAIQWIEWELNGYWDADIDLPEYRQISGTLQAFNPYRGWIPVMFEDAKTEGLFSQAPNGQGVATLEDLATGSGGDGTLTFSMPAAVKSKLMDMSDIRMDVRNVISRVHLIAILDAVRNKILQWTLDLEKSGVLGEGMRFSREEKTNAATINQQIFATNIASIGSAHDQSSITVHQTNGLNIDDVKALVDQVLEYRAALPNEVDAVAQELSEELSQASPDEVKLKTSLQSLRSICEGATGNLTANGILHLLSQIPII